LKAKALTRDLLPCRFLCLLKEPDTTPTCSILIQFKSNPEHAHKFIKEQKLVYTFLKKSQANYNGWPQDITLGLSGIKVLASINNPFLVSSGPATVPLNFKLTDLLSPILEAKLSDS